MPLPGAGKMNPGQPEIIWYIAKYNLHSGDHFEPHGNQVLNLTFLFSDIVKEGGAQYYQREHESPSMGPQFYSKLGELRMAVDASLDQKSYATLLYQRPSLTDVNSDNRVSIIIVGLFNAKQYQDK